MDGKMMFVRILIIGQVMASVHCRGQEVPVGARSAGMAGVSVMIADMWSVINNPAGLAGLEKIIAGTNFEQRFLLKETGLYSLGGVIPVLRGGLGLCYTHAGYSLYRCQSLTLAFGRGFGQAIAAGIGLTYYHARPGDESPAVHRAGFCAGLSVKLSQKVEAGALVLNPFRLYYRSEPYLTLPSLIRAGVLYHYTDNLAFHLEVQKDLEMHPIIKLGFEMDLRDQFYIRSGIRLLPFEYAMGAGFHKGGLLVEISSAYHRYLGITPGISLQYAFR